MKNFRLLLVLAAVSAAVLPIQSPAADYSVTAASVVASDASTTVRDSSHLSAAAITPGQAVYLNSSSQWALAKADASGTANVYGIAISGTSGANQPLWVVSEDQSFTPGFTLAAGQIVILSAAVAGNMAPVADAATGNFVSFMMIGVGGNKAKLKIIRSGVAKA